MLLKSKSILLVLFVLLGLMVFVRVCWYYPAQRRSPVFQTWLQDPVKLTRLQINGNAGAVVRYYMVLGDKNLSFPEAKSIKWSGWAREHELQFDDTPQWIKIFIEEKWLIYKKRSWLVLFNSGNNNRLFEQFMQARIDDRQSLGEEKHEILFLGDSLTHGLFASRKEKGFTALVEKAIGKKEAPNSLGVIKIKTANLSFDEIRRHMRADTDTLVIELGTNDFKSTPLNEFQVNYHAFLSILKKIQPKAQLVCLSTWDGFEAYQYDEIIMKEARAFKGKFVYLGDLFERENNKSVKGVSTPWGKADDFHPSDQGHAEIARRVIATIVQP